MLYLNCDYCLRPVVEPVTVDDKWRMHPHCAETFRAHKARIKQAGEEEVKRVQREESLN